MPRTTREWARRKLEMVEGNLMTALSHLEEVLKIYDEDHPEVSTPILLIQETLLKTADAVLEVRNSF